MQLVAYGAQDIYLTGNPQITFFKVVYRRHTNFSMEAIKQVFNGSVGTSASTVSATISRNGDLVSNLWIEADITAPTDPAGAAELALGGRFGNAVNQASGTHPQLWVHNTGHALIKEVEIEIGGQLIDRHYSQWLDIWNDLTDHDSPPGNQTTPTCQLLNKHGGAGGFQMSLPDQCIKSARTYSFYIPLQFWFCRHVGLSLPLIALQYHEVKLKLKTRALVSLFTHSSTNSSGGAILNDQELLAPSDIKCDLWADYIYLDTDERRRFAQVSHEYLIEQVQRSTGAMKKSHKLNFNHPVKELIWVTQDNQTISEDNERAVPYLNIVGGGGVSVAKAARVNSLTTESTIAEGAASRDYFNYNVIGNPQAVPPLDKFNSLQLGTVPRGAGGIECINNHIQLHAFGTAKLKLNGHDRFKEQRASYFRLYQAMRAGHSVKGHHIYVYSFALKPEEHQPSGTCNFSRIDNASLEFTAKNWATTTAPVVLDTEGTTLTVYAINYNVLRIMSGMGGLAYSN